MKFASRHLLLFISLRHIARHRLRTLLTLAGIVVGVATFIFAPTLAASITRAFGLAAFEMIGNAQLEVTGKDEGFSRRALSTIHRIDGVDVAAPFVQTVGVLAGRSEMLMILGVDPELDRAIRAYTLADGHFIQRSGDVLLSAAYAQERSITAGDHIKLIGPVNQRAYRVAGLLAGRGVARLNNGDLVVMSYKDAQELRGNFNLDSVAITLQPAVDRHAVMAQLQAALPGTAGDALTVDSLDTKRAPLEDIRNIVSFVMGFASLMILTAGSTLVYNTMAVAVAQRRNEIGVLRALGVARRQVRNLFLLEAAVLGLAGSLLGVLVGYALIQWSKQAINLSTTFSSGLTTDVVIEVPAWLPLLALIAGTLVPLIAAYLPARSAAQIDPIEALSGISADTGFRRVQRRRTLAGLAVMLFSVALFGGFAAGVAPPGLDMPLVVTSIFSMLFGLILLLPNFILGLGRITPPVMHRLLGVTGLLAAEQLTRRSRRLTTTAAVLLLGAWTAITVSSGNFGYREFSMEWNASQNVWDLTVAGAGPTKFRSSVSLPAGLIDRLQRRRDVTALVTERRKTIKSAFGDVEIRALDLTAYRAGGARFLWDKGDETAAYTRLMDPGRPAVLLSSFASATQHLQPGDVLTLDTPRGPVRFELAGTVLGAIDPVAMGETTVVMDRNLYQRLWQDNQIDRVMLQLAPGGDAQSVRRDLQQDYPDGGFIILSPGELAAGFNAAIDSMVVVSQILSILLLVTLTLGIANTFVIEVLDRRREMGLLRAIGLRGRQVAVMLVLEVLVLGMLACLLALPLGIFNNYANSLLMGELFAVRFILNPSEVAVSLSLILLSAILASYFPARQAGRVDVLEALHYE